MASADSMAALPNFDPGVGTVSSGFVDHDVRWLQRSLNRLGHCAGPEDGVWGDRTRTGLESFLRQRGYPVTGFTVRPPRRVMLVIAASGALQSAILPTTSACTEAGVPARSTVPATIPPQFLRDVASNTLSSVSPWIYGTIAVGGLLIAGAGYMLLRKRRRRR